MTYRIVDKSELSKRLMWCDTDGIVRFYTFPTCRMRHSRYDKHQVETAQGQKVLACEVDTRLSLVSDYETAEVIERLSEILESKFVWIDRGPSSVRVDVLSTESVVRYGGALNSLQIDIRPHDRKEATL